jgi:hypothetical protein
MNLTHIIPNSTQENKNVCVCVYQFALLLHRKTTKAGPKWLNRKRKTTRRKKEIPIDRCSGAAALPPVVGAGRHRSEHEFLNTLKEG